MLVNRQVKDPWGGEVDLTAFIKNMKYNVVDS
jgi:hypothetical protein